MRAKYLIEQIRSICTGLAIARHAERIAELTRHLDACEIRLIGADARNLCEAAFVAAVILKRRTTDDPRLNATVIKLASQAGLDLTRICQGRYAPPLDRGLFG